MNSGWRVSGGTGVNQVAATGPSELRYPAVMTGGGFGRRVQSFALDYHEVTSAQIFVSGFPAS
jgi:hypothetical protein